MHFHVEKKQCEKKSEQNRVFGLLFFTKIEKINFDMLFFNFEFKNFQYKSKDFCELDFCF